MTPFPLMTLAAAAVAVGLVVGLPWAVAWPWLLTLALTWTALTAWVTVDPRTGLLGRVVTRGPATRPWVALTWDDGPDPRVTPALLDVLAEHDAPGTFFLVGERAAARPELVERLHRDGHLVGNHSWAHGLGTNTLGTARQAAQMERAQQVLAGPDGPPRFYRPPFGMLSHSVVPACRRVGLTPVCWTLRSWDTRDGVRAVVDRVLAGVAPGAIVLLHDGGRDPEQVTAIARGVLAGLAERDLRPVRLDRLLEAD